MLLQKQEVGVNSLHYWWKSFLIEEIRVKSNVHGKGKEKLDPTIIAYVRAFRLSIHNAFLLRWVKQKWFQYHQIALVWEIPKMNGRNPSGPLITRTEA